MKKQIEDKVYVKTYAFGVDFLGWIHFPHHRQIRTITKRKIIRKLKGYPKPETISSYSGLLRHGDTYKIRKYIKIKKGYRYLKYKTHLIAQMGFAMQLL